LTDLYELEAPTEWVEPPSRWSSSMLDAVERCPRRWQLMNSRWGEHERWPERRHPAAAEGQIVHDAIDGLTRACGRRGNPPIGTSAFREAISTSGFFGSFAERVAAHNEAAAQHPRPGPRFLIRVSSDQLANRAIRLFKQEYKPIDSASSHAQTDPDPSAKKGGVDWGAALRARGRLSEVRLEDSTLGFVGVLDQVSLHGDDVVITDFKSGKPKDEHARQLRRYAALWAAATGITPTKLVAQYLNGRREWPVSEGEVKAARSDLAQGTEQAAELLARRPAPARPGSDCRWCAVRARCDEGWELAESVTRTAGWRDVELVVTGQAGSHGFTGEDRDGTDIAVVHEAPVASFLPSRLAPKARLRLAGCKRGPSDGEVEVKAWSEVFVVATERAERR